MTVSAWTTPLNFDIPAFTVTMPADTSTVEAWTLTWAAAVTVMPADSSLTVLPLASAAVIDPGPSSRVTDCPPGVSMRSRSWPDVSSRVIFTPLRERMTLRLFSPPPSMVSGGASWPFHRAPTT